MEAPRVEGQSMDHVARFVAYASAFERAFVTDEWDPVADYFAECAVYVVPFDPPLGGAFEGPRAIVGYLKDVLDRFDRCFASRSPELLGLVQEDGHRIRIRGRVRYTHPEAPELVFELDEVAQFEGSQIVRLEDHYDEENRKRILGYIEKWGPLLGMRAM